jgi:cytidylate kinase
LNPTLLVAIDGAAGSGKSTLARALARALGVPYVNTGLMYRALTAVAVARDVDPDDEGSLVELMGTLRFSLAGDSPAELSVDGLHEWPSPVGAEVEAAVSRVSRHPLIRALMRDVQRELGRDGGVMEGRDIASVVFPDAPVKIYLVADPAVRARRRAAERSGERAIEALHTRDRTDSRVNPFTAQPGAAVIDTTHLDVERTLAAALDIVHRRLPEVGT